MDAETPIRHYTSLEAVIELLRSGQLRLTRLDAFDDPFEGSVPKQDIDNQVPIFGGTQAAETMRAIFAANYPDASYPREQNRDRSGEMTQRRRAKTRSAHASCWAAGHESEALWKLYCREGGPGLGLALSTTLGKLEESVAQHDPYVSPVKYRYYHEGPHFDDEMDAFFHKRKGFEYEQEVRILKFDHAHYGAIAEFIGGRAPTPPHELPKYMHFGWSLVDAINAITVSPYASKTYEFIARTAIASVDSSAAERMEWSVLSPLRYGPEF